MSAAATVTSDSARPTAELAPRNIGSDLTFITNEQGKHLGARFYGVETRALNQAMKRNQERFPADFTFDLAREEILRISQTVTSLRRLKCSKQVRAFTEHGALQ